MAANKRKVLVLGNDTRSFLAVIRSLGRKGIEVHAAWCDPDAPARHSRYVKRVHEIPRCVPSDSRWKGELINILDLEKFDLVIPCDDASNLYLQTYKEELEAHAVFYLLESHTFETAYNKHKMHKLALDLGIPVARGTVIQAQRETKQVESGFQLPVVLRPESSVTMDRNIAPRQEVRKAFTRNDLEHYLYEMLKAGPVLVQEHFHGIGAGVEVLAYEGRILTAFQHARVHEPLHGGGGPYRRSTAIEPELFDAAEKLIRALQYTGVAMFEFKVDEKTKRWIFVEINARFWGSLPLAIAAGIDFPWYLYQMIVEGERDFNREYKVGLYCRNLVGDIEWFRNNLAADRNNPWLHTEPLTKICAELFNIALRRERSDTFVTDDPWPGLVDLYLWGRIKCKAVRKRASLRYQSLAQVKAHSRKRATEQIRLRRNIAFLCAGNICRSPFAEYYAKKCFSQWLTISSSGFYGAPDKQSPHNAIVAAKTYGIDLQNHQSRSIQAEFLDAAGAIFFFDLFNYEDLMKNHPEAKEKSFFLGTFLPGRDLEIQDPIGGDIETFRKSYQMIVSAVENLKHELNHHGAGRSAAYPGDRQ